MKYLLDVNALIAWGFSSHAFHGRIARWLQSQEPMTLCSCSITELGFVRVLSRPSVYGVNIDQSQAWLAGMKTNTRWPVDFIADDLNLVRLPRWVKSSGQTTDGHLLQLAEKHGCTLATFDARIPGAFVIP